MKVFLTACDACRFAGAERVPRKLWMRLLPPLRHYYCRDCNIRFLAPKTLVERYQWMASTIAVQSPAAAQPPATSR